MHVGGLLGLWSTGIGDCFFLSFLFLRIMCVKNMMEVCERVGMEVTWKES